MYFLWHHKHSSTDEIILFHNIPDAYNYGINLVNITSDYDGFRVSMSLNEIVETAQQCYHNGIVECHRDAVWDFASNYNNQYAIGIGTGLDPFTKAGFCKNGYTVDTNNIRSR